VPDSGPPTNSSRLVAVVPSAGRSTRMGRSKPLLAPGGQTFLARVVDSLRRGGCRTVYVGVREADGATAEEARRLGAEVVIPHDVERGPIASVRAALELARDASLPTALLLHPADHPLVRPETIALLIDAMSGAGAEIQIVLPRHGDRRGHPALFRGAAVEELRNPGLEGGARTVVRSRPERVLEVPVEDPGVITNLDTPEQVQAAFGDLPA